MSGRCKACDKIMSDEEMKTMWPGTTDYVELCGYCLASDNEEDNDWLDLDTETHHVDE